MFRKLLQWDVCVLRLPECRATYDDITKNMKVTYSFHHESRMVLHHLVEASRIALPKTACNIIPLLALLPPDLQRLYSSPLELIKDTKEAWDKAKSIPTGLRMPRSEYLNVLRLMMQLNMVEWRSIEQVRVTNGLQCVKKDQNKLRLIFDGRPVNCVLKEPTKVNLPGFHLLDHWSLNTHMIGVFGKIDLDNYYHRLRVPDWLKDFLGLPSISQKEYHSITGRMTDQPVIGVVCSTLPMGLSHAVLLAQEIHIHLLEAVSPPLSLNSIVNFDNVEWVLVYIDDVIIGVRHQDLQSGKSRVNSIMQTIIRQYEQVGLAVNRSKLQWGDQVITGLGCVLDGKRGIIRPTEKRKRRLVSATRFALSLNWINRNGLEILLGHWIWLCLLRRLYYSIFFNVYRLLQSSTDVPIIKFWESAKNEFRLLIWLVEGLFMSWMRPFGNGIIASDASLVGGGTCEAWLTSDELRSLSWQTGSFSDISSLLPHLQWTPIFQIQWQYLEYINVLETRALVMCLSRVIQNKSYISARWLCLTDSMVVFGAICKGRSSSYRLNNQLKRLLVLSLIADTSIGKSWLPTDRNPADVMSRVFLWVVGFGQKYSSSRLLVGISTSTFRAYSAAWNSFQRSQFYSASGDLDLALVNYVESLPFLRRRHVATRLLSAVNHFLPSRIPHLSTLKRYAKQLRRACPGGTKPPMIEEVVLHLAHTLLCKNFPVTAIAVLLQFDCYLRPSELCSVQARHVAFPGGRLLGYGTTKVLLLFPQTKTGILQSVDIRSHIVIKSLRRLTLHASSSQLLFPDYRTYANRILSVLKSLKLGHIGYTPHAIRHGGATMDLINLGYSGLAQIMYRGRWESLAGRRYLQRGAASLLYAELPQRFLDSAHQLRQIIRNKLRTCPLHFQT